MEGAKLMCKIGVISDTHGLIRPEALQALQGVGHIIHAGDIGSAAVIGELEKLAPVTAVRGNVDGGSWALEFSHTAVVEIGGAVLYVIHDLHQLDLDPRAAGFSTVISGHSHFPAQEVRDGVFYFNPGSAGRRRFHLPVTVGYLTISDKQVYGEIITLQL